MTLPRLAAMHKHWESSPPVHVSVAAYLGIGKSKASASPADDAEFEMLMASVPAQSMKLHAEVDPWLTTAKVSG